MTPFDPFIDALCAFEALRIVLEEEALDDEERAALIRAVRNSIPIRIERDNFAVNLDDIPLTVRAFL